MTYNGSVGAETKLFLIAETHKGLKRVTLVCLLCPMLVIIHFRKYHIWNDCEVIRVSNVRSI